MTALPRDTPPSPPPDYSEPKWPTRRLRYFDTQLLKVQDFVDESMSHVATLHTLTRLLHVAGIGEGLAVQPFNPPAAQVTVTAGIAIEASYGRQIMLRDDRVVPVTGQTGNLALYIQFNEVPDPPPPAPSNRFWQVPNFIVQATSAPAPDQAVLLGVLTVTSAGVVASVDPSVRVYSGLNLAGAGAAGAVVLRASGDGTPNSADLIGNLRLPAGTLTVGGATLLAGLTVGGTAIVNGLATLTAGLTVTAGPVTLASALAANAGLTVTGGTTINGTSILNGSLGFGTPTPGATISMSNTNSTQKLFLYEAGTDCYGLGAVPGELQIYSGGANDPVNNHISLGMYVGGTFTERMRITNCGYVGIGTPSTGPTMPLQVVGASLLGESWLPYTDGRVYLSGLQTIIRCRTEDGPQNSFVTFDPVAGVVGINTAQRSGNLTFGTSLSSTLYMWDGQGDKYGLGMEGGNIRILGGYGGGWDLGHFDGVNFTSVYAFPPNGRANFPQLFEQGPAGCHARPISEPLTTLRRVRGIGHVGKSGNLEAFGVLASEIVDHLPHTVSATAKGQIGVSYSSLVALLIEAVKELSLRVEALEKKQP